MNYSYNKNEIVFLKDRDIAIAIDGKNVAGEGILSNGVPSFDLLSAQVWSLSTQDNHLSDYIRDNVEVSCDNLSAYAKALSDEISGTVSVYDADGEYVSNHLSVLKVTNAQYNQLIADGNLKDDSIYVINDSYVDAKGQNIKNLNNPVELSDAANKTYVDDEISSARFDLSADAAFLSATLSSLINRDKKDVTWCGDVQLSTQYIDPEEGAVIQNQLYGLLLTNDPSHNRDRKLHTGFLFRASNSDKLSGFTVDDNNGNVGVIHDNDYILVANEVDAVKNIKLTDVKFIYDYTYLEDIVRNNLSANISADVYSLSVNLSTEISALSAAISTDISALSSSLSNDIDSLSVSLSTDLSVLSTMLSTDIDILSDSISAMLSATSAFLCSDIQALSSDLSTVISCLSSSISSDLYRLSSDLCADIQSLSASLSGSIDGLSVKVDEKLLKLSSDISTDLSTLSAYISADVHHLSDVMDAHVAEIKADVKGGVNYKGHINLGNSQYSANLPLSAIFGYYYNLIDINTGTYKENKSLNNGWLYNITTIDPYTTGDEPPVVLENNDYILIHGHDQGETEVSCVDVSAITRSTIDIVESLQDDYVRLKQLQQLSDDLSADISALTLKTIAADNQLSTAVSSVISVYDKNNNYVGNQLSVRKLTNAEYKDLVIHDTVNARGLYVIDDNYFDAYGQQMKNLADPAELSDATNKKYVDGLVAGCANGALRDLQKLSADLSTDVSRLSSGISADLKNLSAMLCADVYSLSSSLCASVNAEFVHMTGDVGIGQLGLTSTISAQEFVTNPVQGHYSAVKQKKLTYVDASDIDHDPKVYDLSYPEKTGTIALTSDVADLSADVMAEVTYVSAELSDTVTVFDKNNNVAGNKLSTVYVTNAEYDELVRQEKIDEKVLYIINDSYESSRGQKITDLGAPTADTDAATKKYVDDTAASSSATALEDAKAYSDTKVADAESNANTYTNTVSAELSSELHEMAHSSFVHISGDTGIGALQSESVSADIFTAGNDNGPYKSVLSGDGVKVVDQSAHGGTPVEYKITYPLKDGVFALTSDVQDLSASLSAALSGLSSEVSALSAGIVLSCEDLNKDIAYLSNDLSVLEEKHYNVTLSSMEHTSVEGRYPDNLLVVDHTHEEEQHDKYYLKFKYGTLTLVKIQ